MRKNYHEKTVIRQGKEFRFSFWTEDVIGCHDLQYAQVDLIYEKIHRFLGFGKPKKYRYYKCLRSGWMEDSRIDWCEKVVKDYFRDEYYTKVEMKAVEQFCKDE